MNLYSLHYKPLNCLLLLLLSSLTFISFGQKYFMNLPEINHNNVSAHLNRAEIVRKTAEQIMKDFGMFGVEITFSGNTENAYQELHEQLINQISVLVERNYDLLLSVLYQVDITDKEIYRAQQELPDYTPVEIIAHQVIVRDLKKVLLRQYFKQQDAEKRNGNPEIET
jgi:hypothetical protein